MGRTVRADRQQAARGDHQACQVQFPCCRGKQRGGGDCGEPLEMADAAFAFRPLPRVPVYYLLWLGDDEFPPVFKVLFDRAIETCFSASGIWLLVNLVSSNLLQGRRIPEAAN